MRVAESTVCRCALPNRGSSGAMTRVPYALVFKWQAPSRRRRCAGPLPFDCREISVMKLRVLLLGILLPALMSSCASSHSATDTRQSATIGGRTRSWLVHLPSNRRAGQWLPLVVAFHGHGGSAATLARQTQLDTEADRMGFMVVYPDGIDHSWAAGVNSPADRVGVNDVAFVRALLARLERKYPVDRSRIVLTGFSNGAHLVQWLGCQMASSLYAIVPVSGALAQSLQPACHPARPLTVVAFHGTADPIDPYSGGRIHIHGGGKVLSVAATMAFWAKQDACSPAPQMTPIAKGKIGLVRSAWRNCQGNVHVTLYQIVGGGHTWPGGPQYLPAFLIGKATHVVNASKVIGEIATGEWVKNNPHSGH